LSCPLPKTSHSEPAIHYESSSKLETLHIHWYLHKIDK